MALAGPGTMSTAATRGVRINGRGTGVVYNRAKHAIYTKETGLGPATDSCEASLVWSLDPLLLRGA